MIRCHCCGEKVESSEGIAFLCDVCRSSCVMHGSDRVTRGSMCPYLAGRKAPLRMPVPRGTRPTEEIIREVPHGVAPGAFVWRGRVRYNIPGG